MFKKLAFLTSILSFFVLATPVWAVTPPNFPACSNPTGNLVVSYEAGLHGIVGQPNSASGSDKVYSLAEIGNVQCFCAISGEGIQTNWWKTSSLTQDEIEQLKKLGWVYVPTGAVWGLEDTSYMAKNEPYACRSTTSSSSSQGSVLSTAATDTKPQVLGLAATGDTQMLLTLIILSFTSLILGIWARKRKI